MTISAMEWTSTYWKPPFYCLEESMNLSVVASSLNAVSASGRC